MKYYIDCEFDGRGGKLLSMALVSETGRSLYAIMNETVTDPWVRENVVPLVLMVPVDQIQFFSASATPVQLSTMINDFLRSDPQPHIVADWPDDIKYFAEACITGPGTMINVPGLKMSVKRVDAYPTTLYGAIQHNAWWDAMALRHLFRQRIENEDYQHAELV